MKEKKSERTISLIVNIVLLLFIGLALYTNITVYLTGRSLWLDEAMLAYSFSERSLSNLTSDMFSWVQSAPVIYLYIVKIITEIFGITFIGLLIGIYYLSKKAFNFKYPLFPVAFIANMYIMIYFASEFKPYMSDCLAVVGILIIYHLYLNRRINKYAVVAILAISVWLSNPCCFFIGAILIAEFVEGILKKDYKRCKESVLAGVVILISFIIYYFYWLKPVIDAGDMTAMWEVKRLPLIPTGMQDLYSLKAIVIEVLEFLGDYWMMIFAIIALGVIINLFKSNKIVNIIYGGIFISMVASSLGMFPIESRLWLFFYPLAVLLLFYFIERLYTDKNITNVIVLCISLSVLLFSTNGITYFSEKDHRYRNAQEVNMAVDFIEENIKEGEKLYLFKKSIPAFMYKNNYELSLGKYKDNVIMGNEYSFRGDLKTKQDVGTIINNAPVYILTADIYDSNFAIIKPLLDSLSNKGNLELVYDKYETDVYYYTNKGEVDIPEVPQ